MSSTTTRTSARAEVAADTDPLAERSPGGPPCTKPGPHPSQRSARQHDEPTDQQRRGRSAPRESGGDREFGNRAEDQEGIANGLAPIAMPRVEGEAAPIRTEPQHGDEHTQSDGAPRQ